MAGGRTVVTEIVALTFNTSVSSLGSPEILPLGEVDKNTQLYDTENVSVTCADDGLWYYYLGPNTTGSTVKPSTATSATTIPDSNTNTTYTNTIYTNTKTMICSHYGFGLKIKFADGSLIKSTNYDDYSQYVDGVHESDVITTAMLNNKRYCFLITNLSKSLNEGDEIEMTYLVEGDKTDDGYLMTTYVSTITVLAATTPTAGVVSANYYPMMIYGYDVPNSTITLQFQELGYSVGTLPTPDAIPNKTFVGWYSDFNLTHKSSLDNS